MKLLIVTFHGLGIEQVSNNIAYTKHKEYVTPVNPVMFPQFNFFEKKEKRKSK